MPKLSDKQSLVPFRCTQTASLDNFFAGPNADTLALLRGFVAADNYDAHRLLFLDGPPGCGKTHLLMAASHKAGGVYLDQNTASTCTSHEAECVAQLATGGLACVDHLDAVAANRAAEERLFALLEILNERGVRILTAARAPAHDLGFLTADPATRLSAGLGRRLHALRDSDKISALRQHAKRRGFALSDQVMQFIMRRLARDMPSLFTLLDRLDYWSMVRQSSVTVPLLRELAHIDPQHFAPGHNQAELAGLEAGAEASSEAGLETVLDESPRPRDTAAVRT